MCKRKLKKNLAELFCSYQLEVNNIEIKLTKEELEEQLHMKG